MTRIEVEILVKKHITTESVREAIMNAYDEGYQEGFNNAVKAQAGIEKLKDVKL